MRLSLVFELLLIFVLLAFAASRVIESKSSSDLFHRGFRATKHHHHLSKLHRNRQQNSTPSTATVVEEASNKYCSCNSKLCNCCREFNIPVVSLQGPGCASLQYLKGDKLAISMSFGERVLTNTTIDGKKPKPVCMPLPGGISKFCGRVYNIRRSGDDFNACLGLELRALSDVEAALRVSCFKFGSQGLKVEPSQPLPTIGGSSSSSGGDEDDDDDDDDDDEDEFDFDDIDDDDDEEDDEETSADNDVDSVAYGTFSVFDDDFIDSFFIPSDSSGNKKKKPVVSTTKAPLRKITSLPLRVPVRRPVVQRKPIQAIPILSSTIPPTPVKHNENIKKIISPVSTTTQKISTSRISSTTTTAVKTTSTTAAPQQFVTSETIVADEKTPVNIADNQVLDTASPHESIAAVAAMLQSGPPEKISSTDQNMLVPAPVRIISQASSMITEPETTDNYVTSTLTEQEEITVDGVFTEEEMEVTTNDVVGETTFVDTESSQNYIIKNNENSNESDEFVPSATDKTMKKAVLVAKKPVLVRKTVSSANNTSTTLKKVEKPESKDMLTDIINGVIDTISGDDSEETKPQKSGTPVKEEDEDDDGDDDDDDDDDDDIIDDDDEDDDASVPVAANKDKIKNEDNEDDDDDDLIELDDDDDEDESRKTKQRSVKQRGRQSRDMLINNLHW